MNTITRILAAAALALGLAGCGTTGDLLGLADPIVRVAETLDDDATSTKGATAGMASSDARDVLINRAYYSAVKSVAGAGKQGGQQPILEIESRDGKPIVIDAKSVRVYAPPAQAAGPGPLAIAPPAQKKSAIVEFSQEARGWLRDVFVPIRISDNQAETQRLQISTEGNIRQTELVIMGTAVSGSQRLASDAINTYKPTIVTVPGAPAAAPAPAPTPAE